MGTGIFFWALLCAALAPAAEPLDSEDTLARALGAQGEAQTNLSAVFAGVPGLEKLQGEASLTVLTGMTQPLQGDRLADSPGLWRQFHLSSSAAYLGPVPLGELDLHLAWRQGQATTLTLKLEGPWLKVSGTLLLSGAVTVEPSKGVYRWGDGPVSGQLVVKGQSLPLGAISRRLARWEVGGFEVEATVSGTLSRPACQAKVLAHKVRADGLILGTLRAQWDHREDQTTVFEGLLYGRKGLEGATETFDLKLKASLPLDLNLHRGRLGWRREELHDLEVDFVSGSGALDLRALIPGFKVLRPKEAHFSLKGSLARPTVKGGLEGILGPRGLRMTVALDSEESPLGEMWTVELHQGGTQALGAQVETQLDWGEVASQGVISGETPVSGQVSGTLPLWVVEPWVMGFSRLGGMFRYGVAVSGTLGAPQLVGEGSLRGGLASVVTLNRQVEQMALLVQFEGGQARYTFEGESRPGRFKATGEVSFGPGDKQTGAGGSFWEQWHTRHVVEGVLEQAPFVHDSFPISLIDASFKATIHSTPEGTTANLAVLEGLVETTTQSLPAVDVIPKNQDVVFTDERLEGGVGGLTELLQGEGELRLGVVFERPVVIRGPSATVRLVGGLDVERRGPRVVVEGGIRPEAGGRLELYENRFEVRSGLLTLESGHVGRPQAFQEGSPGARPLEPVLQMEAGGVVSGTQVLVRLEGPLAQPRLVLSSQPPLPEYQIMTLLVTGRADVVDDRDGDVRRSVARLVERYHNASLEQQLLDRIGVDRLRLGFGASVRNPVLTVGKQITKRLYVETVYRHGAPEGVNMMEGRIEHQLDPKWTVDTVFGDAAEGRLGLYWTTRFGRVTPTFDASGWNTLTSHVGAGDQDGDGVPDAFDLCPRQPEDLDGHEDGDGCVEADNDGDGILDEVDQAPGEKETFNGYQDEDGVPDERPEVGVTFRFDPLVWEVLPAGWTGQDELRVRALAWAYKQWGGKRVTVRLHGGETTSPLRRLLRRRGRQLRRALRRAGVRAEEVRVEGVLGGAQRVEVVWE